MSEPLLWEELFNQRDEAWRRAPDQDRWRCVSCGNLSKRARTHPDHLCMVCVAPAPSSEPVKRLPRKAHSRRRARRAKR